MSDLQTRLEQLSPLQRAVFALQETKAKLERLERQRNEPIALVGMACRFPGGACDPDALWRLLCDGADAIGEIPSDRWDVNAFYDPDPRVPGKMNSRFGGFLEHVDLFDNHFFGISDDETRLLDPQQRLLLELTWEALEDAGIPPDSLRGSRTGVFLGISNSEYSLLMSRNPNLMCFHFSTGTALSIASNRISHIFDWHGPSMSVDTACSSSLVALHLACQAIRRGDCDTAIVGGANLILVPSGTIILTKSGMSAPDGRIRAFDRSANGYVRSEGVGVLVLKSQSAAAADGDRPYALVRGSAISQTGRANGLSAPVGMVQEATLRSACEQANIVPGRIAYVETQGTGTLMGDAIEAKALGAALGDGRTSSGPCRIGSVKTNLGHLEAASGIASVMKVALCLKHGEVPPSLHFQSPNPMIPFDQLPIRVATRREALSLDEEPAVAGVNGFGYGGSTVHVVLEAVKPAENPAAPLPRGEVPGRSDAAHGLLPISARTEPALRDLAACYRDFLRAAAGTSAWRDICGTALHRREHHDCRLAVIAASPGEAADQLDRWVQAAHGTSSASSGPDLPIYGRRPYERLEIKSAVRVALEHYENCKEDASAVAGLYLAGGDTELRQRLADEYTPVRLPHYAWQRKRSWTDEPNPFAQANRQPVASLTRETAGGDDAPRMRPDLNTPYAAPQNDLQKRIADAWARVLRVEPVGIYDNFFELGGQSLQAALLIHEIQQIADVQLDPIALFEAQTVHDLARYLEQDHAAALEQLLQSDRRQVNPSAFDPPAPAVAGSQIPRIPRDQPLPLSFGQQRFWFLDQLSPGAAIANTHLCIPLHGPLNIDGLREALSQTIARHESLRTVIATTDGVAHQQILPPKAVELPITDLAVLPSEERQREVQRLSRQAAATGFRLDEFPLFRLRLLRLGDAEHVLLLTVHHIVIDGVSLALVLRDTMEFYAAGIEGRAPRLPKLPVQYADYAAWQRSALQGEALESELAFWRQQLERMEPVRLHFDRTRSADLAPRPGTHSFTIAAELFQQLQAVCRRYHVTPFVLMLAAFKLLLARYSSQEDIVIGTPVAGRRRREFANVVGFFVNTLPLRTDLSGDPTFAELLGRVRATYLQALAHQDVPFDLLAKELEPDREANRHPVFQVMLNYLQQVEIPGRGTGDRLAIGRIPTEQPPHGGEFDLVLVLSETGDALDASLGYNAALFDASTIERISRHLLRLLECIILDAERPLSRVDFLEPEERRQLLDEWNCTAARFSTDKCLHELVEEQARKTPDGVAAVFNRDELTFQQLNRQANRLAHLLRQRGVQPDQLVGLCLPRSLDAIVAMLGILKAGGGFLPIDPSLPTERVAAMLEDAQAVMVVTDSGEIGNSLPAESELVYLSEAAGMPDDDPPMTAAPQNLAYAIFTSGSTGRPKGVLIEHRSVVNLVEGFVRSYQLSPQDRVLQNTTLAFDVSINEIFPALCSGATIVISDHESQLDATRLAGLIHEQNITIAGATPTVLSQLNRVISPSSPLRLVLSGGEALSRAGIDRLLQSAVVTNGYGPTEACIAATCYPLQPHGDSSRIPIGKPLANYRVYVVDSRLTLIPIGCAGELCITGIGLARGYANDPELTATKFVECPFEPGQRMYRTGDLARWRPDGNLEFLGRIDRQIKLRGRRIELGEIESALLAMPEVQAAVVVNHQAGSSEAKLVAYVVPSADASPTALADSADERERLAERVAARLRNRLPEYMLPSAIEWLPAMPLTAGGKIDHRQLPKPTFRKTRRAAGKAPCTPVEKRLARIWSELLSVEDLGIDDNFFQLGGHSLLAVKAMTRIRDEFQVDLPLAKIFTAPTLAQFALEIDRVHQRSGIFSGAGTEGELDKTQAAPFENTLVRIGPGEGTPLYLVHGLGGYITNLVPLARELNDRYDVYALEAVGPFDDRPPHASIPEMAEYYVAAVRRRQPDGPYLLAGWSMGGTIAWEMCRQLIAQDQTVGPLTLIDAHPLWTYGSNLRFGFVASRLLDQLGPAFADIRSLPKAKRWQALIDRAGEYQGPGAVSIGRLIRTCEAHLSAGAAYVPERIGVDVTALWAKQRWGRPLTSPWRSRARSYVARTVPGDHYSMLEPTHVGQLAAQWRRLIAWDSNESRKAG